MTREIHPSASKDPILTLLGLSYSDGGHLHGENDRSRLNLHSSFKSTDYTLIASMSTDLIPSYFRKIP